MLCNPCHVKGSQPNFVLFRSVLCPEKMCTTIQPPKRIFLSIKSREGKFVIAGNTEAIFMIINRFTLGGLVMGRVGNGWNWGRRMWKRDLCDWNRVRWWCGGGGEDGCSSRRNKWSMKPWELGIPVDGACGGGAEGPAEWRAVKGSYLYYKLSALK